MFVERAVPTSVLHYGERERQERDREREREREREKEKENGQYE